MDSFDISSDSEEGLLDEIVVGSNYHQQHLQQLQHMQYYQQQQQQQHQHSRHTYSSCYDPMQSPIHYCDTAAPSDDNSGSTQGNPQQQQQQPLIRYSSSTSSNLNILLGPSTEAAGTSRSPESSTSVGGTTDIQANGQAERDVDDSDTLAGQLQLEVTAAAPAPPPLFANSSSSSSASINLHASTSTTAAAAGASFNNQLTTDMCNYKNSKSRRLEYSLKCLKYGRSNPSQDSAFGSLTDNDLSIGSSSFRLSSFQSISSPIDEGVEDVIIATTTAGKETCLELATIPRSMVSQDSAISSPCRESSPSNFLNIDDGTSGSCSGGSSSSGSASNIRPQHFPVSLSPKILVTATSNSSNSSLASAGASQPQTQQFDPPKILVNDQNSIYTTSPSKRSGMIEVFSQKYRVSSFEDMSPHKRSSGNDKHLKNVNRMAFRSLEEERRIDNAFMPITDRTNSENRVNMQSEKYKKLTHASFRISKTSSQVTVCDTTPGQLHNSTPGSSTMIASGSACVLEMQRPATASGSISSRQTMWRDSKFYRKNRIAKSNDSLLETSPNHSARLSPSSLRDNHYDSCSSYGSRSHSRQSLHHGCSITEILGANQSNNMGLAVTTSFYGNIGGNGRRYVSSKSEDLGEAVDYLRVMDTRKSYSERHLVTLTKLKQTCINNTMSNTGSEQCCISEDEMSFNDDNNAYGYQYETHQQQHQHHQQQQRQRPYQQQQQQQQQSHQQQMQSQSQSQQFSKRPHPNQLSWSSCSINRLKTTNIKTTSLATLCCQQNSMNSFASAATTTTAAVSAIATAQSTAINMSTNHAEMLRRRAFRSFDQIINTTDNSSSGSYAGTGTEENSSTDDSPIHQTLSGAELSRIFAMDDTQGSSCSEEKTPLLDSVEMSPMSPTDP